jgi:hypothetical protein
MSTATTAQVSHARRSTTVHIHGPAAAAGMPARPWFRPVCAAGMLLFGTGLAAAADAQNFGDAAMSSLQEETATRLPATYEVNSAVLPDFGDYPARNNPSLSGGLGGNAPNTQHLDITRWLSPQARAGFGLSLGLSAPAPGAAPLAAEAGAPASLDMGVRWRSRLESGRQFDISAWARTPQGTQTPPDALGLIRQSQQPLYGTRLEMQWASSKTGGLTPEFGAVGVQLQSGSRLVLRARKGGPMLYYRAKF